MALKKKKISKFKEEQLYMLEILVDHLNLCPEKIINNKKCDLMIRIDFIDFAPVDIFAEDSIEVKSGKSKDKENRLFDENINYEGKTYLFVRTPSNLMQSVKLTPLSLEVYRILRGKNHNLRDDTSQILLCAATAFLPGCFYDRVAAAKNKIDGLSKPYTLTEVYTLTDEKGSSCGSISMYLRLSCFGSSIINHLTLHKKLFILQGFPFGSKFRCAKSSDENVNVEENEIKCEHNVFSLLKILNPTTKLHDQNYCTNKDSVLMRPESPPRVSIDQPGFEKLTSAEKLNDHKYRSLIYEIYPDEPTCSCLPTDRSTHPMMCRSGCARTCCMTLRNPDILKDNSDNVPSLTYCVDNLHLTSATELSNANCCNATRMRGGVDGEVDYLNNKIIPDDEYMFYENNIDFHAKDRMKGGSNYGTLANATSETTSALLYQKTSAGSPCKFRPRTADRLMAAGCICPKDLSSWRTDMSNCTKKPCIGANCMIRAFKEAQDIVDSLNKVQGMADLGLMDPSESPYFGIDIDKDYAAKETPSEIKRGYPVVSSALTPYATFTPTTPIAVPGRAGVVREAIPTLPEATLVPVAVKPKKKEEKKEEKLEKQKELDIAISVPPVVDVGPCGEPKCKSRRKTPENSRAVSRETNESQKNSAVYPKPPSIHIKKSKSSEKGRRLKDKPGPDGDIRRSPIKISKQVMRYVYSIGDVYPGIHYGHKNCLNPRFRIPANMGWLWNTSDTVGKLKPRIGWKPGAIVRRVNELLKEAKGAILESASVLEKRLKMTPSRTGLQRGKVFKTMSYASLTKEDEEETEPPPTLHIHRKDGTYYVTMYPIRQQTADPTHLEEPIKPLQFKIARNKDDASVASSSTASDMEIEFSPPAAVSRYRRKPDVIHVDTQVRQQEILDAFKSMVDVPKKKERKGKRGKK